MEKLYIWDMSARNWLLPMLNEQLYTYYVSLMDDEQVAGLPRKLIQTKDGEWWGFSREIDDWFVESGIDYEWGRDCFHIVDRLFITAEPSALAMFKLRWNA